MQTNLSQNSQLYRKTGK